MTKPKEATSSEKAQSGSALIKNKEITFELAAKRFTDDEDSRNNGGLLLNPYDASSLIAMDELEPSLFVIIDKMEVGEMSAVVDINTPGSKPGYKLVRLNKRTKPHRASLEDDYQKIAAATLERKKNSRISTWFEKARNGVFIEIDPEYDYCDLSN